MTREGRELALQEQAPLPLQLWLSDSCSRQRHRQLQRARRRLIGSLPATWVEKELEVAAWRLDKAFACEWLDAQRLLVATKCNSLVEVDLRGGVRHSIELPPEPAERRHATVDSGWGFCGIHSIDVNPARTLVVTGGKNPTDAVVLRLPDYKPLRTLTGHVDWVFAARWVSDGHVVTGSRDGGLALWDVGCCGGAEADEYAVQVKDYGSKADMKRKVKGRVREVKYDFATGRLAALGTEGCVKLFDVERDLRVTRTIALAQTTELVCMAQRADLVAAGACGHVNIADPRQRAAEVRVVQSPDGSHGVRSAMLQEHLLSFGTGLGKLVFMDMRTWRPLPLGQEPSAVGLAGTEFEAAGPKEGDPPFLQCGPGWLHRDELYWDHFQGVDIRNAIYAHAWDPTGSRLFACGGPLAFGLRGCYMALWR